METIISPLDRQRWHLYLGRVSIQVAWYFWIHWIWVALTKLVSQFTSQCGNHYIVIGQTQVSPILRKSEYTRSKIFFQIFNSVFYIDFVLMCLTPSAPVFTLWKSDIICEHSLVIWEYKFFMDTTVVTRYVFLYRNINWETLLASLDWSRDPQKKPWIAQDVPGTSWCWRG